MRLRFIAIAVTVVAIVWWALPAERKQTWRDKLRELVSAVAVGVLVYWVFIVARWSWQNL